VRGAVTAVALAALLSTAAAAQAASTPYVPVTRKGPSLDVPAAKLRASLRCSAGVAKASRDPILLIPGTNLDPKPNYGWNYERAFKARGWPYCTVTLPYSTMGDVQVAGEYVVHAIRSMARSAKRRVDILGFSQGGMLPRWALRFWPGTRAKVDDAVGLDPSNHGTVNSEYACQASCPPAYWQQASGARFIEALNSRAETFAGIDYTVIYSNRDEVVVPNSDDSGSSSIHTGGGRIANVRVQDICPADNSDHLAMGSYDAVGYALAVDAFTHPGVAKPARIASSVCTQPFQPGVDPSTFAADYAGYLAAVGQSASTSPEVPAEPPLRCYVLAACRAKHPGRRISAAR
jgi:triacylglycerol esterase/lipase EstA (alpha/beta hydrolase family)